MRTTTLLCLISVIHGLAFHNPLPLLCHGHYPSTLNSGGRLFLRPASFASCSYGRNKALIKMTLSKVSLFFDFDRVPYAAGIQHIHSPEHVSETHRLGAPFFKVESVEEPKVTLDRKTSICFTCSTLFMKDMRVRMFSHQPNESNMYFFKDNRALYGVKFSVIPTKVEWEQFLDNFLKYLMVFWSSRHFYPTACAWTSHSSRAITHSAPRSRA